MLHRMVEAECNRMVEAECIAYNQIISILKQDDMLHHVLHLERSDVQGNLLKWMVIPKWPIRVPKLQNKL